jgi:hypothetical protein
MAAMLGFDLDKALHSLPAADEEPIETICPAA